jgi:cardiolipin synthase
LFDIFTWSWTTWKGRNIVFRTDPASVTDGLPVIPIFARSGRARRRMRKLFIQSINTARNSICITTAYFMPGRKILKVLEQAAGRGVNLRLILPGQSDSRFIDFAEKSYYRRLLKAGIEIFNFQGTVLHSKTAVFDNCWSIIGSTNLDFQSFRRNEESNVGILDPGFARHMMEIFQKDLERSVQINAEIWKARPLYHKILEKCCSFVIRRLLS